jgi:hypothetical protein
MTKDERERMKAVINAAEYLFLENLALKLVMEHRAVPNWQKLVDRLMADQEILAGVHLKFRDLNHILARSVEPSTALQGLLGITPPAKKPH